MIIPIMNIKNKVIILTSANIIIILKIVPIIIHDVTNIL